MKVIQKCLKDVLRPRGQLLVVFASKAQHYAITFDTYLFSSFIETYQTSRISGNSEETNILQTNEQLIQFSWLLPPREVLFYFFSEQIAAKGNSPATIR